MVLRWPGGAGIVEPGRATAKPGANHDRLLLYALSDGDVQPTLAHRFDRESFFAYRQWLVDNGYADKTVYGALTLAKQVFKWGFHEGRLREYRLGR
jgi:hypothetical protein